MLARTFRIGKLAGIDIDIHWSFVLLLVYFWFSQRSFSQERLILSVSTLLFVFVCVIAHEMGHAAAARWYAIQTRRIVLWPLGGFAVFQHPPHTPRSDLVISAAGPLVNLAFAAFAFVLRLFLDFFLGADWPYAETWWFDPWYLSVALRVCVVINLLLGSINLLPIYPLDGGHILRDLLEMAVGRQKADTVMLIISIPLAVVFGGVGVFLLEDYLSAPIAVLLVLGACLLSPRLSSFINKCWAALFRRGDYYFFYKRDLPKALAAYNAYLQRNPNDKLAQHNRAAVYADLGEYTTALSHFTDLIRNDGQNFKLYYDRANSYRALRMYTRALADYEQAIALNPTYMYSYHNRGATYHDTEQYDQAVAEYDRVLALDASAAKALADRAWARFDRGDDDASVDAELARAHAIQPDDPGIAIVRGLIAWLRRDYPAAYAEYERAFVIAPTDPSTLYVRGLVYLRSGDDAAALGAFDQAIQRKPTFASAYAGRGLAYLRRGDLPPALSAFDTAITYAPNNSFFVTYRSMTRFAAGDVEGAIADLLAVADHDARSLMQAEADLESFAVGQRAWALATCGPLLAREDTRVFAYICRGDMARWSALPHDAVADYTCAIAIDPCCAQAYMRRGRAFLALEQHDAARSDFEQVVALHERSRIAREAAQLLAH